MAHFEVRRNGGSTTICYGLSGRSPTEENSQSPGSPKPCERFGAELSFGLAETQGRGGIEDSFGKRSLLDRLSAAGPAKSQLRAPRARSHAEPCLLDSEILPAIYGWHMERANSAHNLRQAKQAILLCFHAFRASLDSTYPEAAHRQAASFAGLPNRFHRSTLPLTRICFIRDFRADPNSPRLSATQLLKAGCKCTQAHTCCCFGAAYSTDAHVEGPGEPCQAT